MRCRAMAICFPCCTFFNFAVGSHSKILQGHRTSNSDTSWSIRCSKHSRSKGQEFCSNGNIVAPKCNASKAKHNSLADIGFSLGVDLGDSSTGVAVSIGFAPRPLPVLHLRGQKLEQRLMELAQEEEADEFIIGLPKSLEGLETVQSNKVRSIAGRFAVRAAERGWRVFLQDEQGTSKEALELMIERGLKRTVRRNNLHSYAAVVILQRYFSTHGHETELVWPKDIELRKKLVEGTQNINLDDF